MSHCLLLAFTDTQPEEEDEEEEEEVMVVVVEEKGGKDGTCASETEV